MAEDNRIDAHSTVQPLATTSEPAVPDAATIRGLPLGLAQRRLWFLAGLGEQASEAYVISVGLRLRGALDRDALQRSLDAIYWRHDVLRARIVESDGEPCLVEDASAGIAFPLSMVDLRDAADNVDAAVDLHAQREFSAPFDLRAGPLIRACLLRLPQDRHVLLLNVHHVIFDGVSLQLLLRELDANYRLAAAGEFLAAQSAPRYADCIRLQHSAAYAARLQRQNEFWRDALRGVPLLSTLPSARARPAQHDFAGAFAHWCIDAPLTARLRALAKRHEVSLFGVLLAAWASLIQRLNPQDEAVVGVSTSGRTGTESRDVIGCFVGTVPVRVGNLDAMSVAEAIVLAAAQLRAAAAHQDLPFDSIVDTAGVQRNLAHNPLFQTLLNWYGGSHGELGLGDLDVAPLRALERRFGVEEASLSIGRATPMMLYGGTVERVVAKLDLSLLIWESAGELTVGVEYATALFDGVMMRRHLGQWQRLLEGFVADDAQDVNGIALMSESERRRILYLWNDTDVVHPAGSVLELMRQHVARAPEAPALEHAGVVLTYAQLDARAASLAQHLRQHGIGLGDRVAIALERGVAMVVALLAVLRCGAAYVPLDLQHPPARRQHVLDDSGVVAMLVQGHDAATGNAEIVLIDVDVAGLSPDAHASTLPAFSPQDLAYVMYTSGTTGMPKGVMVEHASLANLLLAMRGRLGMQPHDRVLALTTLSFDISALEIFLPLISGARIVMADRQTAQDPYALARLMDAGAISVMQATPTTWRMLIDSGWRGSQELRALSGGEPLPGELAERVATRVRTLWNVYGPTETTIWSTLHHVAPSGTAQRHVVEAIGRPLDNSRVYVLDGRRQPVPVGVSGMLYIGGAGLARGYVGLDALTQERFVPDPFVPGQRMYCSGDLARWDDDGVLHHLGRNDAQVKLHGHRIELAEIESQLSAHPSVAECAVALRGRTGDATLVAYCVLDPSSTVASPAAALQDLLREHLLRFLPLYMVPEQYVVLPELPVSSNGKLDRSLLPEPTITARKSREAPRAGVESEVAAIWSELFDGRLIDRHDNFFRIGGHSLLAVRVVARLRSAAGVEIGVTELFAHPTLAGFAAVVARSEQALRPALLPDARGSRLPLSFAQQRLWFIAKSGVDASRAYHMPLVLHLRGALDLPALQRAIHAIGARHEALRTVFPEIDGQPSQHVLAAERDGQSLRLIEIGDGDAAMNAAIAAEVDRHFDLTSDVPLRAALLRVTPSRHVLVLTAHHIACDGWSLALLQNELMAHYNAARSGTSATLPALPIQYADYAVWQRRHRDADALDAHARYWKDRLTGAPALIELPADRPRPPQQDFRGDYVACAVDASLTGALRALAARHETTLFVTVLAGWAALLSRLTGATDLVVGMPVANRDQQETENLIGFFANTLPLRLDLVGNPAGSALVEHCRDEVLAAQRHGELPFERLVELLRPARSTAYTTLFQIAFAWQSTPPVPVVLDGLEQVSQQLLLAGKTAKFDLTLYLWETPQGLDGGIEYATSLFDRSTVERYLAHWLVLLRALADDEQQRLRDLPLLDLVERDRLLQQWACGSQTMIDPRRVDARIEAMAFIQPDAIAVQQRDDSLSYRKLDSRANALAARLAQHGIGAGDRVGVCLPRSTELIVALLGVLKSGAAYLLLDAALPASRLAHMLDDSAVTVLIAHNDIPMALLRPGRRRLDPAVDVVEQGNPADRPARRAGDIAYVIYTSGSSGMPKGIAVEHRGLSNLIDWLVSAFDLAPGCLASGVCGLAFDASVIDIWPTLCAGATLRLAPIEASADADALLHWWSTQPFHSSMLPTPLAELVLAQGLVPAQLRVLATGGARLTRHRPANAGFRLLNLYGPAETTVVATWDEVTEDGPITIGRPIANLQAYVLDEALRPQPVGVAGELHLGGVGIAAGYLGLPELSAQRFLPDPFSSDPGARLYRTGDLARWLADGRIEFVGRADDQVKLRGMRVELGEIESALAALPQIREAAVVPVGQATDVTRLVAYVVLQAEPIPVQELTDQRVAEWTRLYDDNYRAPDMHLLFDFGGWNSSYTGESIALDEMEEWRAQTVERILALHPRRVLEIGCGSGLLMLDIAPRCERYVGVDFSREALQNLQLKLDRQRVLGAELVHARADELDRLGDELFDTVVINSVVQYFPNERYLADVIGAALGRLTSDGHLFVGDVRNLLLLDAFHASVNAFRRGDSLPSDELAALARASSRLEKELLIAPRFFRDLADAGHAADLQLLPKIGSRANELTKYRYDVVLHRSASALPASTRLDATQDDAALDHAFAFLDAHVAEVAVVCNIHNAMVEPDANLLIRADGMRSGLLLSVAEAVARARARGFHAEPSWLASDSQGRFHLLIAHAAEQLSAHAQLLRDLHEPPRDDTTNEPVDVLAQAQRGRELAAALSARLPDYMVPSQFVFLARLPLTPNGKVDRAALPAPETLPGQRDFVAPATRTERLLASIWREVLGCPVPGASDHFFELGGHSLAAVQVLARVRREVAIEVSPPDLFAHPVLADFARFIDKAVPAEAPALQRAPRDAAMPLSFEQEGLWFLAKLPGAGVAYNIVFGVRLHGRLRDDALRGALDALVQRHESLRTVFVEIDGRPQMRIVTESTCAFRRLVAGEAAAAVRDLVDAEIDRQFDLEAGPLFRATLLRESAERHVLVFSMHHIVSDGWSARVLLTDFAALYSAHVDPRAPRLPMLPLQYADWVASQRQMAARHQQRDAAYWQMSLQGAPPLLELAADRSRPTQQDFRGGFVPCHLDAARAAQLRAAARRFDTTPFVLLLTSWALLLQRLSGQDQIVVGTPSANRSSAEAQALIGLLVSILPLRLDLSGTPSLAELIRRTERVSLEAQRHQDIAFEKIVELVSAERSLAYNPVFQVMFAWQAGNPPPLELGGLRAELLPDCEPRHAKFDLSLILAEKQEGIHGGIEYASALFDESTIERYRDHWLMTLEQLVTGDDTTVDRIELLTPTQRHQVLEQWNETGREFPHEHCLHTLFEQQAAATPQGIALEAGDERLTFAELDARANQLAAYLIDGGVHVGSFVAIHIARSVAMIVAVLATLKAGAAYVPLDTSHPAARKAHVLGDCRPGWLLHAGDVPSFTGLDPAPVAIDVNAVSSGTREPSHTAPLRLASTELAYIIYTSGSTGMPKGVMLEHRSVVNRLAWMQRHFAIGTADAILQKTALGFDVSVWEVFLPLICGARLVLAEPESHRDPQRLARVMREKGITILHFVPSMLHLFLAQHDEFDFPMLKHVVCSGEELPPAIVEDFQHKLPRVEIQNLYGPTEASIDVSWHRCAPGHGAVRIPIGRPIDNCRLYVLDPEHRLQPPGVTGELYIGGVPVARGYFNRPDLNATRFLPDPFAPDAHARMYKTGDQARWLPHGEIDFLGRNDAQVKLRGFRIELSEIESHLARFPGVVEATVALRQDSTGDPGLVAYWVAADANDESITAAALRAHLAAALPDYMVPARFLRLAQLPLNANGKLDRSALPAFAEGEAAPSIGASPTGDLELRIATAWHDVLGRGGIGRDDNFFAIGGHSLLTLRVVRLLRQVGLVADVADVFRYPTIATLAQALQQRTDSAAQSTLVTVREGDGPPLFLFHDGFGLLLYAHVLAAQLPTGIPACGLADTASAQDESASIALLADRLLPALRERQPHGPYRLAGWSFGGLLAYEIATRLIDDGEAVEYLGLIDSYYGFDEPGSDEHPAQFTEVPPHVAALDSAARQTCLARHEIYALAARRYAARPLHVVVDLIKTKQCEFPPMQEWRGWERVLPPSAIRVHEVDGCHYSMMTAPFIAETAAAVARGLVSGGPLTNG